MNILQSVIRSGSLKTLEYFNFTFCSWASDQNCIALAKIISKATKLKLICVFNNDVNTPKNIRIEATDKEIKIIRVHTGQEICSEERVSSHRIDIQ